jgi:hypothetical protein
MTYYEKLTKEEETANTLIDTNMRKIGTVVMYTLVGGLASVACVAIVAVAFIIIRNIVLGTIG